MRCSCWICGGEAKHAGVYGDWDALECQDCGRYKISRKLLNESLDKKFDVQLMRAELWRWPVARLEPVVNRNNAHYVATRSKFHASDRLIGWPSCS